MPDVGSLNVNYYRFEILSESLNVYSGKPRHKERNGPTSEHPGMGCLVPAQSNQDGGEWTRGAQTEMG